jgi:hypothetical protein
MPARPGQAIVAGSDPTNRKGAADRLPRPRETRTTQVLMVVAIVVMVIPVAICMPTMAVFVPPPMRVRPAVLAGFMQLTACAARLSTLPSMVFDSFVQPMIGSCDAPLACCFLGANGRCADKNESTCECHRRKRGSYPL